MLAWVSVWSEVQTCIWPRGCHCHSLSLASVKSRLVLPFWYRLSRVVPEKGPLNGCVCVSYNFLSVILPSVLCHCWLGVRKSIRRVKIEWWGVSVVSCMERGADCLRMVQLKPLPSENPSVSSRLNLDRFCLSGTGLSRSFWKRGGCSGSSLVLYYNYTIIQNWF